LTGLVDGGRNIEIDEGLTGRAGVGSWTDDEMPTTSTGRIQERLKEGFNSLLGELARDLETQDKRDRERRERSLSLVGIWRKEDEWNE